MTDAPWPHGTAVRFHTEEAREAIRRTLENAARHYPAPGRARRRDPPAPGLPRKRRRTPNPGVGSSFGVLTGRSRYRDEPDLNFHGLIRAGSPAHRPSRRRPGLVGTRRCRKLSRTRTRPAGARKKAVETLFLEEMREAARTAIYRAMAKADPAPVVAFEEWKRARAAGVELSDTGALHSAPGGLPSPIPTTGSRDRRRNLCPKTHS